MAKNTKGKKTVESVAETLCSFSRFLCDLVIGIYLFVILAVLPLYNRGYAQIGTDKENFFIKTMTYVGKCLLPVFVLWLILRFIVVKQKQELPEFRTIPKRIWQALNTTDKFAALYGIAVVMSYVFTRYREEALWGTVSWRMGMWTQLGAVIVYFMISRMWQRNDWIVILTLPVSTIVFFLGYMNKFGLCLVDKEIINSSFISTVGNINWYCGYLVTVLFGGVYLLWWMGSEITWKRALLMGYVTIGFASLVTQGSSSGVVTLAVRWQKNGMLLAGNDIVIGGMSDHIYSAELQCAFAGTADGKSDGYPDVFRNECDYDDRVSSGTVAGTYQQ